jgi:hypothetical protein
MKNERIWELIQTAGRLKGIKRLDGVQNWSVTYNTISVPILTSQLLSIASYAKNSYQIEIVNKLKTIMYNAIIDEVRAGVFHPDTEILGELYDEKQGKELVEIMMNYLSENEDIMKKYLDVMRPVTDDEFIFYMYKDSIDKSRSKYVANIADHYQSIDAPIDRLFTLLEKKKNNHKLRSDLLKDIAKHSTEENSLVTAQELIILAVVIQEFSGKSILSLIGGEEDE